MSLLLDAFWRAAAYCLHPRVIVLSLLPLLIGAASVGGSPGWLYWDAAVAAVQAGAATAGAVVGAVAASGSRHWAGGGVRAVLAPLIVVVLSLPVIVVVSLLLVALLMAPAIVRWSPSGAFRSLERRHGAGAGVERAVSLGCTVVALVALVVSLPLWFVPPLVLVLPPLIWGWLTYRVMAYDALAEHAERRGAPRADARASLAAAGHRRGDAATWAPRRRLLWALGALHDRRWRRCWCRCRSGSTRWCSRSRRCGSRTTAWRQLQRCAAPRNRKQRRANPAARRCDPACHCHRHELRPRSSSATKSSPANAQDKHLPKVIELLAARGLQLAWAALRRRRPRAHHRRAARRLRQRRRGVLLRRHRRHARRPHAPVRGRGAGRARWQLHPRGRGPDPRAHADVAREQGLPYEPERPDNIHRLNMGVFPQGARDHPQPVQQDPRLQRAATCTSCRAFR